jgi:hypothetical protein
VGKRITRIFSNIDKEVDAIVIRNSTYPFIDDNFFYVTGLTQGLFENCLAIVYSQGDI